MSYNIVMENTAQSEFLDVLEHLSPTASDIHIRTSLSGEIDGDILEKCAFTGITSITFAPGNITSIRNLPAGITKVLCVQNRLTEVPSLPASVVELDLKTNAISKAEGPWPADLKELTLSDNPLDSLEELPKGLEILRVENCRLKVLRLEGLDRLRVLHCSGNRGLIIENLPDTLEDFESENDVLTEIHREDDDHEAPEKYANYQECLYEYFELKKAYVNRVSKVKRDTYLSAKTKKEARARLSVLKPKCILCDRPVGSIFENKGRHFIARCGDKAHPCAFHIELFAGEYGVVTEMMESSQRVIDFTKQNIIENKLDVLFKYMDEKTGVELFKEDLDFYTKENVQFTALKHEYDSLYFDEELHEKLAVKKRKIGEIKDRIRDLVQTYRKEDNPEILEDAMTVYVRELMPEIQNEAVLKWPTREMNENDPTFTLFQRKWRLPQVEYTFGEYPRVIHYKVK